MPDDPQSILFISGMLVFASIIASILSDRMGVPALLVFLSIGMLAGSDGPGGIHYDDAHSANFVGTLALAYIIFSGGLDTNWRIIRPIFARGAILSTVGVVITAGVVGLFSWGMLGFSPVTALLLGAIISSTDAAAVFSVLRGRGVGLKGELRPLLEFESGSNDPMAIFLTIGLTALATQPESDWHGLLLSFLINASAGVAVGYASGRIAGHLINRIRLEYEGLYPVLSMSLVLMTFGTAEGIGGNGYLAVYLCGILLNGTNFVHKRHVVRFHSGLAWLMQIVMFLVLGLLVFPSQLPGVAPSGLMVVLVLMFVARPLAVLVCLARSRFNWREKALISWTGLRGAVPIVLATFPLLAGFEQSHLIFDIVFFTVLISVALQGTLLMPVARWLGVDEPMASRPVFSLEIEHKGQARGETQEIEVQPNMAAVGRKIMDLELPPEVLILLIGRGEGFVVPRGETVIEPYDTLLLLGESEPLKEAENAVLSPARKKKQPDPAMDPLSALPLTTDERYLSKQVVVAGHGRVGSLVCGHLRRIGVPCIAVDENREIIEKLRAQSIPAVVGDAARDIVLVQAHLMRASALVITIPDPMIVRRVVDTARKVNPGIHVVIRADNGVDAALLEKEEAGTIVLSENELAAGLTRHVLDIIK